MILKASQGSFTNINILSECNERSCFKILSERYVIRLSILEAITIYHVLVYFCVVLVTLLHTVTNLDLSLEKTNPTKNPSKNGLITVLINRARGKDLTS